MAKIFDKDELQRRVDEVLFYVWDPIGISHEPAARGEYESYVAKVLELVKQNDHPEPVAAYLTKIVNEEMGLSLNNDSKGHDLKTAELLLDHKDAIEKGLW